MLGLLGSLTFIHLKSKEPFAYAKKMHAAPSDADDIDKANNRNEDADDKEKGEIESTPSSRGQGTEKKERRVKDDETQVQVNKSWIEALTFTWPFSLYVGWVLFM